MKKDKQELVKADRKKISKDIKMGMVVKLKELTFGLGGSKKLENEIEKALGKLAKKLSKKLKADRTGVAESGKKQKAASGPESNAKQNSPSYP